MHRGILVYFAVLIILAIIAIFLYNQFGGSKIISPTTTSVTTTAQGNVISSTTSAATTKASTTSSSTTSSIFASCISKNATAKITNGDFSTGTYLGWNATGPGFGSAPFNITYANANNNYYGSKWTGYVGTYMATTFQKGLALQAGNLTSIPFTATELYLNFKIISQQNSLLYVEVLQSNVPKIVAHYNTYVPGSNSSSTFWNATIPLGTLLCQNLTIRLVAGVTGKSSQGTNFIAAGDFYLGRTPVVNAAQPVNQTFS